MPYQVKRPSETRLKNGKRTASTTRAMPRRPNPGLGPVMGSFFGMGPRGTKPTKEAAPAKDAAKEGASKKK